MRLAPIFLLLLVSTTTLANEQVAKIFFLKGSSEVVRDGKTIKASRFQKIVNNDLIKVGNKAIVVISFGLANSSKMKLSPGTSVVINRELVKINKQPAKITNFLLRAGTVVVDHKNPSKRPNLVVKTRNASMGVRGTAFLVNTNEKGETSATVKNGEVMAKSVGRESQTPIKAGEGTQTNKDGGVIAPKNFAWAKDVNWNMDTSKGPITQPKVFFSAVSKSWKRYKDEQEALWKEYVKENQEKLNNWKQDNEDMKKKMFAP